jgi:hypothetical protein
LGESVVVVEAVKESVEVAAGVAPVDRGGVLLPVVLEADDPLVKFERAGEVAGGQRFALQD